MYDIISRCFEMMKKRSIIIHFFSHPNSYYRILNNIAIYTVLKLWSVRREPTGYGVRSRTGRHRFDSRCLQKHIECMQCKIRRSKRLIISLTVSNLSWVLFLKNIPSPSETNENGGGRQVQ